MNLKRVKLGHFNLTKLRKKFPLFRRGMNFAQYTHIFALLRCEKIASLKDEINRIVSITNLGVRA
jgi:hypothetical protein